MHVYKCSNSEALQESVNFQEALRLGVETLNERRVKERERWGEDLRKLQLENLHLSSPSWKQAAASIASASQGVAASLAAAAAPSLQGPCVNSDGARGLDQGVRDVNRTDDSLGASKRAEHKGMLSTRGPGLRRQEGQRRNEEHAIHIALQLQTKNVMAPPRVPSAGKRSVSPSLGPPPLPPPAIGSPRASSVLSVTSSEFYSPLRTTTDFDRDESESDSENGGVYRDRAVGADRDVLLDCGNEQENVGEGAGGVEEEVVEMVQGLNGGEEIVLSDSYPFVIEGINIDSNVPLPIAVCTV